MRVSIVLPTYNSRDTIKEAVSSIQNQTYHDWEMIIVNDAGSNDGTYEIVSKIAQNDSRIRVVQLKSRKGLAESLNIGIRMSSGEYIARMDADDWSYPDRLKKQVEYLDRHKNVGICGTWQLHYGKNGKWIHKTKEESKEIKARSIFWCELCHSTVMMRKDVIVSNDLFYDGNYMAEDHELWSRCVDYVDIVNIPIILGKYREDNNNITNSKLLEIHKQSGFIAAKTIERNLGLKIKEDEIKYLNSWINEFDKSEEKLYSLKTLLTKIYSVNCRMKYYDEKELLKVIAAKWYWAKYDISPIKDYHYNIDDIGDIFSDKARPSFANRFMVFLSENKNPICIIVNLYKMIINGRIKSFL